jgi:hypothetical protein
MNRFNANRAPGFRRVTKTRKRKAGKRSSGAGSQFRRDRRRKHRHWQVTVFYRDGEKFARVYIDRERAERFAARQKKSPVVKSARILEVD